MTTAGGPIRRVSAWNIANYLTVLRIALVPVFGWFLLAHDGQSEPHRWVAFGIFVMAAGRGGKLKTMLQAMALGLYILPLDLLPLASVTTVIAFVLLLAALVVTAVTGVDYVIDALRLRQTSERAAMKRARRAGQGGS